MITRLAFLLALAAGFVAIRPAAAGAEFVDGTLDISVTPTSAVVSFDSMMPGDSVEGSLTVENNGSLDLRYAINSTATNEDGKALKDALVLVIENWSGEQLYSGDLDGASGALVGDPSAGQQPGDRLLNAGDSEELTFAVELPLEIGNSLQDAETTATFTFAAEEVGEEGEESSDDESEDGGTVGDPSVATGDSGLRNQDATNSANPIDPLIPLALFAGSFVVMLAYAQRAKRREMTAEANAAPGPAESS